MRALPFLLLLLLVRPAHAQCGAAVSECRACHEVRGTHPVLSGGQPWHRDHAFGDFCAQCHRGDPAARDPVRAHAGFVSPLVDVAVSCGCCHGDQAAVLSQRYLHFTPPPQAAPQTGPVAWRNAVAAALAIATAAGGAGFVAWNERRLRGHR